MKASLVWMENMVRLAKLESSQKLAPRANEDQEGNPGNVEDPVPVAHLVPMALLALMGFKEPWVIKDRPATRESLAKWDPLASLVQ